MSASTSSPPSLTAEDYNQIGSEFCREDLFEEAVSCYNEAIQMDPSNFRFYFNRGLCFMKLSNYTNALKDARKCGEINRTFVETFELQAKCLIVLGELETAQLCVELISQLDKNNAFIKTERCVLRNCLTSFDYFKTSLNFQDLHSALEAVNDILKYSHSSIRFKIIKAALFLALGRMEEAESFVINILLVDNENHPSDCYRGKVRYVIEVFNAAIRSIEACSILQMSTTSQNHSKRILTYVKIGAIYAMNKNDFSKAFNLYSEAIQIDSTDNRENARIYFNLSIVTGKLENIKEAIDNCSKAIELNPNYLKAYLRRAQLYRNLKRFEESVTDYEKVIELEPLIEEYYDLLEVTRNELCQWLESQAA